MEMISTHVDCATGKMPDNKLLALLLSSNSVHYYSLQRITEILNLCQNKLNKLYSIPLEEMPNLLGITMNDSAKIKAAFELARRRQIEEVLDKPKISCSKDAYELFEALSECPYEEFHIIILNKANRVLERRKISEGGVSGTIVDIKRIFHETLSILGCGLILIHNHPSGNLNPSDADKAITKKIKEAGLLMEIAVLDHIIIGHTEYFSFADEGQL